MWKVNPDLFESDDVAKLCPVSYRTMNMAAQGVAPVSLEWIWILLDTCGQANWFQYATCGRRHSWKKKKKMQVCVDRVLINTFSCHKLLTSILNWWWKESICQKLCCRPFYVGIIFSRKVLVNTMWIERMTVQNESWRYLSRMQRRQVCHQCGRSEFKSLLTQFLPNSSDIVLENRQDTDTVCKRD